MQINRKCVLACVTTSARYTLMAFGPTQRGPTLVQHSAPCSAERHTFPNMQQYVLGECLF